MRYSGEISGFICYGVDLNRLKYNVVFVFFSRKPNHILINLNFNINFDFKWMVSGSSGDPCKETYAGPSPASGKLVLFASNKIIFSSNSF